VEISQSKPQKPEQKRVGVKIRNEGVGSMLYDTRKELVIRLNVRRIPILRVGSKLSELNTCSIQKSVVN